MSASKMTIALQALETALSVVSGLTGSIERKSQADTENWLNLVRDGTIELPCILLVVGKAAEGALGSDCARDDAIQVDIYWLRSDTLSSSEATAGYKRLEDWLPDFAIGTLVPIVEGWTDLAGGPFYVGQASLDFSSDDNPINAWFLDKKLPFYSVCVSVEAEISRI